MRWDWMCAYGKFQSFVQEVPVRLGAIYGSQFRPVENLNSGIPIAFNPQHIALALPLPASLPPMHHTKYIFFVLSYSAGRVEFLRPYLTRLDIFPSRRNPENAPIRMEELRALVRKWNLHHKRNFWRENSTKDDVVAALNRHIKHIKVVHENIENKKAERREADRKRQVQNTTGESDSIPRTMASLKRRPPLESASDTCLYREGVALHRLERPVDAGLPTDSVENGIIYMSRWGQENSKSIESTSDEAEKVGLLEDFERGSAPPQSIETDEEYDTDDMLGPKDDANKMQAQQKCCLALLNMTMRDQVIISSLEQQTVYALNII